MVEIDKNLLHVPGKDGTPVVTSEVFSRSVRVIDKLPRASQSEKRATLKAVEAVHVCAAENLRVWESSDNPGVKMVISKISALDVIKELVGKEERDRIVQLESENPPKKEVWVVFSGAPLGFTDGGSHAAFELLLERAMKGVEKILNHNDGKTLLDVEIVLMGSPIATGGMVSAEWVGQVEHNGIYEEQSKLSAECLANEFVGVENVKNITLTGHSFGAVQALKTCVRLPDELKKKTRILADSVAPAHSAKERWAVAKGVQLLVGIIADSIPRLIWERPEDGRPKSLFDASYRRQLKKMQIDCEDDDTQALLKKQAIKHVWRDLWNGPLEGAQDNLYAAVEQPVYVRLGVFDPTTSGLGRVMDYLKWAIGMRGKEVIMSSSKESTLNYPPMREIENAKLYPYRGAHGINRIRNKDAIRWVKTVNKVQSFSAS